MKKHNIYRGELITPIFNSFKIFFCICSFWIIFPGIAYSQQPVTVTGLILDKSGEALAGVNITIKGTKKGTAADAEGKFSIVVNRVTDILEFTYLGYEKIEQRVDISKSMTIVMKENTTSLDEVIVIGYQDVLRRDLTGAIGKANVEDMLKAPVPSFDQALAGRVAGVSVSSNEGMPGATMNINIRGKSSITQSNSPLYIVDGFPVEDESIVSSINPNDIEAINILKDASATAIYGSRAANGVVLVTTKRGVAGKLRMTYDFTMGTQTVIRRMQMMDAYEFVKLQAEVMSEADLTGRDGYFATIDDKTWTLEDYRDIEQYDWQGLIFRDPLQQSHNLSLTGGSPDARYNASVSYYDQDGILYNSSYNRMQGRFGTVIKRDKLTINLNSNFSRGTTYGSSPSVPEFSSMNNLFFSVWAYRPATQPKLPLESLLDNPTDTDINPTNDYRYNPFLSVRNEYRKNVNSYQQYNAYAEYELINGLKLKLSGGYTINTGHGEAFNNSKTRYGSIASTNRVNGSLSTGEQKAWLNENTLVYQTNIKDAHAISSVVGMSFQESINENFSMSAHHIPNESLVMAGLAQGTPGALGSSVSEWSMVSYFGRFNYNYLSKYYFTATFRADGSSKFAKGNQFGYFPSGSFAWTFTNERFMKSLEHVINSGKLRTSWGKTGNNRVGEYATYAVLDLGLNIVYPYNEIETNSGAYPSVLGNKKLKWETTTQTDIGLDLSFFNDRVGFTFDWYRKVTSDLLLRASLVPSSGFTFGTKNIGKVQNEGFEYTLNTQNIRTKNFKWSTDFNISFNTNTVLGLAENQQTLLTNASFGSSSPNYAARVGYPIGMMYGFIYEGIYTLDDFDYDGGNYTLKADIPRYVSDPNPRPGYPKHADLNNDGVIDSNDQTIIGRGDPLHIGGITNNFTYKGFDLSVFFQWSYGNDILCGNRISFENGNGVNTNKFASYSKRFILGDESTYNSNIPVASGANSNGLFSSRWIEDGSYIRLKTIMLGYTLPSRLLNKIGISRLHLFVSAQNLYTWTNYTGGYDPEVSVRNTALTPGVDYSAYPRALSFNTGLNMTF